MSTQIILPAVLCLPHFLKIQTNNLKGNAESSWNMVIQNSPSSCSPLALSLTYLLWGARLHVMITTNSSSMNRRWERKNNREGSKGTKLFFLGRALDICSLPQPRCNQSCPVPLPETTTGAKRLRHCLNPPPRHQPRDWSNPRSQWTSFPRRQLFSNSSPLISSVILGGHK